MSRLNLARRGRRALVLATVAGVAAATVTGTATAATQPLGATEPLTAGNYLVTLAAPPAATYTGGVSGIPATRAATGQRMDTTSAAVTRYRSHLRSSQSSLLSSVGVKPTAQYTMALNGFAAKLTAQQAAKLAGSRGVLSIVKDELQKPQLFDTSKLVGLQGASGGWAQVGGQDRAGKGVVVGVLDSGIWPENAFFAGSPVTRTTPGGVGSVYKQSGKIHVVKGDGGTFTGICEAGPSFPASICNTKLVGARAFGQSFLAGVPADQLSPYEYVSPRDGDGHGSHTASTAAGNAIRGMVVSGRPFGKSSGMAPAAKIAAYKVCWEAANPNLSGCRTADILSAIDAAVADNVDVINFSIGGTTPSGVTDPTELAFLNAAAAGIFVAASAGNSGPGASTADHNSPWLTTVAATTAHRFEATVQLGNGAKYRGSSFSDDPLPSAPLILASSAAAAGATAANALLCIANTLDPAKVAGKIVVCDRGVNDRVAKSAEVKRAGGVGVVMTNPSNNTLNADIHSVPTVHLQNTDRAAVHAYAATAGATAQFLVGDQTGLAPTPIPVVAGFSSRGPDLTSGGDLVKPDITAPGVDVIAAVAPGPHNGNNFEPLSGTSMSSPHIAGLAAVILGKQPNWSPMTIKSAMMTTAGNVRTEAGTRDADPFNVGAGFVNARTFLDPGLVYDSGVEDWISYLEGVGFDTGTGLPAIDSSDLNLPSIGVGALAGKQTVKRKVTAVAGGTYTASVSGLAGIRATVSPATLKLKKGQTGEFSVTFTRRTAALDTYAKGFLTWTAGQRKVRSPIVVQPVAVAAPAEISGTGASGSQAFQVTPGATGPLPLSVAGLTAGTVDESSVAEGELNPEGDAANKVYEVTIPEGTTLARFDEVAGDDTEDLDLFVFDPDYALVDLSATSAASERVTMVDPAPGTYLVVVNGYSAPDGAAEFTLRSFVVPGTAAGNLTVTPNPVNGTLGQPATVTAAWSGLTAGTPYLGWIGYQGSDARTIVSIG